MSLSDIIVKYELPRLVSKKRIFIRLEEETYAVRKIPREKLQEIEVEKIKFQKVPEGSLEDYFLRVILHRYGYFFPSLEAFAKVKIYVHNLDKIKEFVKAAKIKITPSWTIYEREILTEVCSLYPHDLDLYFGEEEFATFSFGGYHIFALRPKFGFCRLWPLELKNLCRKFGSKLYDEIIEVFQKKLPEKVIENLTLNDFPPIFYLIIFEEINAQLSKQETLRKPHVNLIVRKIYERLLFDKNILKNWLAAYKGLLLLNKHADRESAENLLKLISKVPRNKRIKFFLAMVALL